MEGVVWFGFALLLLSPTFQPSLSQLNPWDESVYIDAGRRLLEGQHLTQLAFSPLSSIFYALMILPFRYAPTWMAQAAGLGRLLLFALIWWGAWLVTGEMGQQMKLPALQRIAAGLFLVTPISGTMLSFPSDPLFAGFAALCLWQVLSWQRSGERRGLVWSSIFLGLATLGRNDGLVLVPVLLCLAFLGPSQGAERRPSSPKSALFFGRAALARLLASAIPFLLVVGGYCLLYGLQSGSFDTGLPERTYDNFEAGQQVIYAGTGTQNVVVESKLEARRIFGSPEENGFSPLRAIQRNPAVYFQRLRAALARLPEQVLDAYSQRFSILLVALALRGVWETIRRKQLLLLAALALWPLHLASGLVITLFRSGHLLFPFYVVFGLAGAGAASLLSQIEAKRWKECAAWVGGLALLSISAWAANKLAIYYGTIMLLAVLLALAVLRLVGRPENNPGFWPTALLLLFAAGVILRGGFPSPSRPDLGADPQQQAVTALANAFPPGSLVAAGAPGPVWAARMTYGGLASTDVPSELDSFHFVDWLRGQGFQAVYIDYSLYVDNPAIWALIEEQIGSGLERIYQSSDGDLQILKIK